MCKEHSYEFADDSEGVHQNRATILHAKYVAKYSTKKKDAQKMLLNELLMKNVILLLERGDL